MNKKLFFPAAIVIVMGGIAAYFGHTAIKAQDNGLSSIQIANIEALSTDEQDSYKNGFRVFYNEPGGAYDCEKVWRPLKPDPNYPCF